MSERIFRVTVRGAFDGLTETQRAELFAAAAQHDLMDASFTPEGHLAYDLAARPFFTFRFLESGEKDEDIADAPTRARGPSKLGAWEHGGAQGRAERHPTGPGHPAPPTERATAPRAGPAPTTRPRGSAAPRRSSGPPSEPAP